MLIGITLLCNDINNVLIQEKNTAKSSIFQ
jgi:hypothetical protein